MSIKRDALTNVADFRHEGVVGYAEQFANDLTTRRRIASIFGDVVDLKRMNETMGTPFADKVLGIVGRSFGFDSVEHDEIYGEKAAMAERRSLRPVGRSGSEERDSDFWGRKGGDEFLGIVAIDDNKDPRDAIHPILSRIERNLAFALQKQTEVSEDPRFATLDSFPLRFGYTVFEQGTRFDTLADLVKPSDAAVNIAKLLGKIRDGVRSTDAFHVQYLGQSTLEHDAGNIQRTTGMVDFVNVSADIHNYEIFEQDAAVTALDFGHSQVLGCIRQAVHIRRSRHEEIYVGARFKKPFSGKTSFELDWIPVDRFHPTSYADLGMYGPPSGEVEKFVEELVAAN